MMRDVSLRWGFGMGLLAAVIGGLAQLLSAVFSPIPANTTADLLVVSLLVQGILSLLALGIMFAISYLAGQRAERDRLRAFRLEGGEGPAPADRSGAVLAGGIVAICYWFVTTLILYLVPPTQQGPNYHQDVRTFLIQSLLRGVFYVLVGAGMGGLGGRSVAARQLLQGLVKPATTLASSTAAAPALPNAPAAPMTSQIAPTDTASDGPTQPSPTAAADGDAHSLAE